MDSSPMVPTAAPIGKKILVKTNLLLPPLPTPPLAALMRIRVGRVVVVFLQMWRRVFRIWRVAFSTYMGAASVIGKLRLPAAASVDAALAVTTSIVTTEEAPGAL